MKLEINWLKFARGYIILLVFIFSTIEFSLGANRYLVASGDWRSTSCWSETSGGEPGFSYPVAADIVYIERGYTVTVSADSYCNTIYLGQAGVDPGNIVVNTGVKLSYTQVTGMTVYYMPRDGANSVSCSISGNGAFFITDLTIGSATITPSGNQTTTLVSTIGTMIIQGNLNLIADCEGDANNTNSPVFLLNEGTVSVAGNIIPTTLSIGGDVSFMMNQGSHTGTLKLASSLPWQVNADFKAPWGTGSNSSYNVTLNEVGTTVEYNGTAQNVRQLPYYNLTLSGSGAKTLGATTSVDGTLSLQGSATCINSPSYGPNSTLEYKGSSLQSVTSNEFTTDANAPLNLIIENTAGVKLLIARTLRTGVPNTLTLKSGILTNTGGITLSDNSTIIRIGGNITAAPVFGANINIVYEQHTIAITTSFELPASTTNNLNNLTINNTKGITLNANAKVKGVVTVNGMLICNTKVISGAGSFILNDNAVFKTSNASGIDGSITVLGTKTFNPGASYFFNGTVAQVTGSLFPPIVRNLTVENTYATGLALTNNVEVTGLASVTKNLDCVDKIISGSGSFSLGAGASIFTANTEGISIYGTTGSIQVSGARTFNSLSNFYYNGTTPQSTGSGIANINKLTISNATGVTLSASTSDPAICGSLYIDPGALFIIGVNNAISITGNTTLNSAECLVIKSSVLGTGSFIDNGYFGSGSAKIERWVSNNGSQRWEYVSSPITNASSTVFTSPIHSLRWADEEYNTWRKIIHSSPKTMQVYRGYTRSYQATNDGENTAAVFVGIPNSGSLDAHPTFTASAPGVGHGWNLLGNPYPSAIDWYAESGWVKDNIWDAIYFRKNGAVCTFIDGYGTMDATSIIPPMQAFWVRVADENGGTLQSDNHVRVHSDISAYKRGQKTVKNQLHLTIANADNSRKDDAYVCFRAGATNNFDAKYDAAKLYADDNTYPQIYSITGTDTMAINQLEPLSGERIVKLGFKNLTSGNYKITVDFVSSLTSIGYSVYIEDTQTGATQDLSINNTYNYTVGAKGTRNDLVLHFNLTPLPIELMSFEPRCANNEVEINWSTASETNNHFFTIERSIDAFNWEFVNRTEGNGNSNTVQNYSVIDKNKIEGTAYYRLTQTDMDGKSKTFNPVALNCNTINESITFFPNPFSSSINVLIKDVTLNNATIKVYNMLGSVVYSKSITNTDFGSCEIDLQDLENGIYTIELKSDFISKIEKIIKK